MTNSLRSIEYGRWVIGSDPDATRIAYAELTRGSPEECGCDPCLNFAAQRNKIYSPRALALFEFLAIQPDREAEIYHMARLESGKHLYGGWFHFVGSIISGADAAKQISENVWRPDLDIESENFSLGFTSRIELIPKSLKGLQLVQLEFTARIPWILAAKEPK